MFQAGFIPDFGLLATWVSVWLPGEPSMHKSTLDKFKTGGGVATEVGDAKMVEAMRCNDCGMVQLFARKPAPVGASPA
jgi:hypothetical protein